MLRQLHDDQPTGPPSAPLAAGRADGPDQYMLTERMQAWSQLAAADIDRGESDAPAVFVTTSREVWDQIADQLPEDAIIDRPDDLWVPVQPSDSMAGWRQEFLQTITSLSVGGQASAGQVMNLPVPPPVDADQDRLRIEVLRIAHTSITGVLGAAEGSPSTVGATQPASKNTVIVAVESAGTGG